MVCLCCCNSVLHIHTSNIATAPYPRPWPKCQWRSHSQISGPHLTSLCWSCNVRCCLTYSFWDIAPIARVLTTISTLLFIAVLELIHELQSDLPADWLFPPQMYHRHSGLKTYIHEFLLNLLILFIQVISWWHSPFIRVTRPGVTWKLSSFPPFITSISQIYI